MIEASSSTGLLRGDYSCEINKECFSLPTFRGGSSRKDNYSLERTAVYLVRVSDVEKVIAAFLVRVTDCVWSTYVTAVRSLGPSYFPPPRCCLTASVCVPIE